MKTAILSLMALPALCLNTVLHGAQLQRGDVIFVAGFDGKDSLKPWTTTGDGKSQLVPGHAGSQSLLVERPADLKAGSIMLKLPLPVENLRGARLSFQAMVKAEDVATPPQPWNGVKFMLHTIAPAGPAWAHRSNLIGTFDWQPVRFAAAIPTDATDAWIIVGLEATTGKAWFDDITVTVAALPRPRRPLGPATQPVYKGHDLPRLRGAMIHPRAPEADLRTFAADWKANLVRWQLHWPEVNYGNADARDPAVYDAWLEGMLSHLDRMLPVCRDLGLMVVVDLHTAPGGHDRGNVHRIFQDAACQRKFLEVWDRIARRYKGHKAVWGYDLLNEPVQGVLPQGLMDWQALATQTARNIRAIDPDHAIIVEPEPWGSPEALDCFEPIPVSGVVYSVHMYQPHQFTHQGVFAQPLGLRYPGLIAGRQWDKETLRAALRPVIDFQRDYAVHIYIGEFSAIRWAPQNSAYNYLRDCIDIFEENGWDWTYHAFREWSGWSVEHSEDHDDPAPSKTPTDRQRLLKSWFARNAKPVFAADRQ